ncbi:MAG: 3-hydroxybutyryl-CoA dehydrogenase [Deltaproteobacteria bacterium]|nr:3-hydroxybutyryl-CoA dehydrogenase [Deltaproteobacteria bacterium]
MKPIQTIGVIGSGQMGSGIAQVAAQAGYKVVLVDLKEEFLKKAISVIDKSLAKLAEKGKIQDIPAIKERIRTSTQTKDLANCDFIVEAITENEPIKFKTFEELDRICKPETFFATNTSSISITRIAGKTKRPERIIGMHFMNPVPMMELVEIIRGLQTSDETYAITKALAEKMGKISVLSKDSAGFIVNRILVPMINEAIYALYQGIGTAEDIDKAMKLGTHQPMGPLTLADFVGLDTILWVLEVFHESFGDKFKPCPLLKQYVDAGWLGRKTGRGFYTYS